MLTDENGSFTIPADAGIFDLQFSALLNLSQRLSMANLAAINSSTWASLRSRFKVQPWKYE